MKEQPSPLPAASTFTPLLYPLPPPASDPQAAEARRLQEEEEEKRRNQAVEDFEYAAFSARGRYLSEMSVQLYPRFFEGQAGYHLVTPFLRTDVSPHEVILINRGWVKDTVRVQEKSTLSQKQQQQLQLPQQQQQQQVEEQSRQIETTGDQVVAPQNEDEDEEKEVEVKGYLRRMEREAPSAYTPKNEPEKKMYYWLDGPNLLQYEFTHASQPPSDVHIYPLVLDSLEDGPDGVPKGKQTSVNLRNTHLSYIITWYGLTVGLIAMILTGS